jgi:2-polyprenyl-6-methoxyphenol hydroxylase-like FAD-dependent oxidoreductase
MSASPAKRLHIGVIGAGTAGLATAIAFARAGHTVDVFEKHPALATLGAGVLMQPQGVAALDELGVGAAFNAISLPIDRLVGQCERGWTLVDIPYTGLQARAVSRSALGGVLERECHALGVRLHFGCAVGAIGVENGAGTVDAGGVSHRFDLVVIANGASSMLPAATGLAVASHQYTWGALWALIDLDDWKRELLALWPESKPVVDRLHSHSQLAFARYHHARPSRLAAGPICIVGDAGHAMSPQLGLGTTLAVQDALVLARCVDVHGAAAGALRYSASRLRTVRAYQALSRTLTPCFQLDGKGLWRDLLFAGALKVPGSRYLMYRSIAAPRRCLRQAWAAG